MSGGMWAPADPSRKPDLLERFIERHPFVSLGLMAATGLGCAIAYPESWWGRIVLGTVAAVAGFIDQTYASLKTVPPWAWLVIIPLWGIWRRVAAIDERLKLTAVNVTEVDVDYEDHADPPASTPVGPVVNADAPRDIPLNKKGWLHLLAAIGIGVVLIFAAALLARLARS